MVRWFFNVGQYEGDEEQVIVLRMPTARQGEGDDMVIGDTIQELRKGETFGPLSFEDLLEAGAGIIEDGKIVEQPEQAP